MNLQNLTNFNEKKKIYLPKPNLGNHQCILHHYIVKKKILRNP